MSATVPKRLAVIGGGVAGHQIAYSLQGSMHVTLIDPKTYVEVPMAVPRLLVEPDALPARMPFTEFLPSVNLVRGQATAMTGRYVEVTTGAGERQTVEFDYAVIATGSRYVDPLIKAAAGTVAERRAEVAAAHEVYRSARSVVIVGGGAVGVEVAAEFAETLPHVKVVIVEAGDKLLEFAPSRFGGWAAQFMKSHGIEVILGDRVASPAVAQQPADGVVKTLGGRTIRADVVIWATGVKIATEFVARSWPEVVGPDGRLATDQYLRLTGHSNIFVAGDTTNLPERRMGLIAGLHAAAIVKNLKAVAAAGNGAPAILTRYVPQPPTKGMGRLMVVTFGRRDGLTALPFGQFRASFLARGIKAKDMLVGRIRKGVGLKFP